MERKNYTLAGAIIGIVFKLYFIIQFSESFINLIKAIDNLNGTKDAEIISILVMTLIIIIAWATSLIYDCMIIGNSNKKSYYDNAIVSEIIAACLILVSYVLIISIHTSNIIVTILQNVMKLTLTNIITIILSVAITFTFYMIGYKEFKSTPTEQDKIRRE